MPHPDAGLYARVRRLLPELIKFGVVGGIGTVIDLGGAALLHNACHVEALGAKAISVTLATTFTYLGSRFWTFRDRENQSVGREAALFVVLNLVGLAIAEAVIAFVTYVMRLHGSIEYNVASLLGTGLGTVFRYYAYRKWVFLAPAGHASGLRAAAVPAPAAYPPWELELAVAQPARPAVQAVYPVWDPVTPAERPARGEWDLSGPGRAPGRHRRQ